MLSTTDPRYPYTRRAAVRRQRALIVVAVLVGAIIGVGIMGDVPTAGYLFAGLLGVLALVRLVAPTATLGALATRSRGIDVVVFALLAIGLGILAGSPNL